MHGSDRQAGAIDDALQLHQATGVDGDHGGSAGFLDGIDFGARHRAGQLGELDGERTAETAALFRRGHLREGQPANISQQFSGARFDAQLAQGMATVVIGDDAIEARADILDAGHFQQETRKLPNARLQRMRLGEEFGIVLEQIREMMRDHGRAGSRRHNDVFGIAKDVEKMPGDLARFLGITGVERRLAAAGLRGGEMNLVA